MNKKFVIPIITAILVIGSGSFLFWNNNLIVSQEEKRYIEAMTADTYGGKTPQETLDLFLVALEAEDAELASKYFMLDDNLSREKWLKMLIVFKEKGLLDDMVKDINPSSVKIELNKYSNLWKIVDFN